MLSHSTIHMISGSSLWKFLTKTHIVCFEKFWKLEIKENQNNIFKTARHLENSWAHTVYNESAGKALHAHMYWEFDVTRKHYGDTDGRKGYVCILLREIGLLKIKIKVCLAGGPLWSLQKAKVVVIRARNPWKESRKQLLRTLMILNPTSQQTNQKEKGPSLIMQRT